MSQQITSQQITIPSITISPAVAIRHGLAVAGTGDITMTAEIIDALSQEDREVLATLLSHVERVQWLSDLTDAERVALIRNPYSPASWQNACAVVRRVREERASARSARIAAAIAAPLDIGESWVHLGIYVGADHLACATPEEHARIQARLAEGEPERQRLLAARKAAEAEAEAKRQQKAEAEAAHERAKAEYLAAWIEERGGSLAARQRDGLLCRDEALSRLAASVLDPIALEHVAPRICDDRSHACGYHTVTCLPEAAYDALVALRQRLPDGATVGAFQAVVACLRSDEEYEADDLGTTHYVGDLIVPAGPFTFTRVVDVG